jgi:phosphoglucosamine mutase
MLQMLVKSKRPASQMFQAFEPNHQKLCNLRGIDREVLDRQQVTDRLAEIESEIAGEARILVRPSGTENLIRVMVESADEARLDAVMQEIILLIETESKK